MFYFGGFFSQTGIFAGFSLHIINLAVRISAAMMAGDIIFLGCRTVNKGAMNGARGGEKTILFLEISRGFSLYFVGRISEAAMGGPRSSFRGRRSSVGGCSFAQKGAA